MPGREACETRTRSAASRPRRSSCSQCRRTHVLLPASMLVRRADDGPRDRCRAAGEGGRSGTPPGRGRVGPTAEHRAWLAAPVHRARGERAGVVHRAAPRPGSRPLQRRLRPVRCSVMPSMSWVWRRPRRPGCSGPDRHGSSPPRQAVVCCWAPVCCPVRAGRPTRADPGQRPATPTAFGLADHDVITRSWRPDGPQSTAGPQRRTGPGRSR